MVIMDSLDKKPVIFLKCKDAVLYYIRRIKNFLHKHPNIANEFGHILSKTFPLVEIKKSDIPNELLEKYLQRKTSSLNNNNNSISKPKSRLLITSCGENEITNPLNVQKLKVDKPNNQTEDFNVEEYFEMINEIIKFDSKRQVSPKNISSPSFSLNESSVDLLYTNHLEMSSIKDIHNQFNHERIFKEEKHTMEILECDNIDLEYFNDLGYLDLTLDLYGIDTLPQENLSIDAVLNTDFKSSTTLLEHKKCQQSSYNIFKQLEDETNELNFDPSSSEEENSERGN